MESLIYLYEVTDAMKKNTATLEELRAIFAARKIENMRKLRRSSPKQKLPKQKLLRFSGKGRNMQAVESENIDGRITIRPETKEDASLLRSVVSRQMKTGNPALTYDPRTGSVIIVPKSKTRGDFTIVDDIKRVFMLGQSQLVNLLTSLAWAPLHHKTHEW